MVGIAVIAIVDLGITTAITGGGAKSAEPTGTGGEGGFAGAIGSSRNRGLCRALTPLHWQAWTRAAKFR